MKPQVWITALCPIIAALSLFIVARWAEPVFHEHGVQLSGLTRMLLAVTNPLVLFGASALAAAPLMAVGMGKSEEEGRESGTGGLAIGIVLLVLVWAAIAIGLVMPVLQSAG